MLPATRPEQRAEPGHVAQKQVDREAALGRERTGDADGGQRPDGEGHLVPAGINHLPPGLAMPLGTVIPDSASISPPELEDVAGRGRDRPGRRPRPSRLPTAGAPAARDTGSDTGGPDGAVRPMVKSWNLFGKGDTVPTREFRWTATGKNAEDFPRVTGAKL